MKYSSTGLLALRSAKQILTKGQWKETTELDLSRAIRVFRDAEGREMLVREVLAVSLHPVTA
jgi:hypothetical protein